jgi:hypothetical protein
VEQDADKKEALEMQQNLKLLEDKNRMLLSQVVTIRRENTQKEKE